MPYRSYLILSLWSVILILPSIQEYGGYITDITRTFPPSHKFTSSQSDLYNAVLAVQRSCISLCRADSNITLDKLHDIAETALKDNLVGLGFDMSEKVRSYRLNIEQA